MNERQNRRSGLWSLLRGYRTLFRRTKRADESPEVRAREIERRFLKYTLEQRRIEREKQLDGS